MQGQVPRIGLPYDLKPQKDRAEHQAGKEGQHRQRRQQLHKQGTAAMRHEHANAPPGAGLTHRRVRSAQVLRGKRETVQLAS